MVDWKLYIDSPLELSLESCGGSLDEDDGCGGCKDDYDFGDIGYGDILGGGSSPGWGYGSEVEGDGHGVGRLDGYGAFDGNGRSATQW